MPQKRIECFTLLFDNLAWIEHEFLSSIRDSRKAGSLWGMMRGVEGVRKSIHQSWLAKGLGLGLLCWGLREFGKRSGRKRPALFKSGQWHFQQDSAPVHNSILVTDYLTKMSIKTVPHLPYSPDLAPCDFWLFPKLRGCYEIIEEMKEAVTKVIETLTQEDFHGALQKLLERYKCIAVGGYYFEGDKNFMCVLSIKMPIRKKSGNLFNNPRNISSESKSSSRLIWLILHKLTDDLHKFGRAPASTRAQRRPPLTPTINQPCIVIWCQVLSGGRHRQI